MNDMQPAAFDSIRVWGRVVARAEPEKKLLVFRNQIDEAAGLVRKGVIEKQIAVDCLFEIARANRLIEANGTDHIQQMLAAGFAPPIVDEVVQPGLDVVCLSDVKPRPIEWLWKNWLAIGKVSILAGEGGKGKSTILCDLAARTTRGDRWPDGADPSAPGSVLILAAEDDVEDTLAPRLLAAGAVMERVFNIRSVREVADSKSRRRSFNLQADLARLEDEIKKREGVRLVIIDPISSYLGRGVDSHKNAEVRSVLEPLGELAARLGVAVLCNNHFAKAGGSANHRMIGSVGFVNYCRAGFIVTPDAEDQTRLLLLPSKMNIAPIKHGLAYRIESYLLDTETGEAVTSRIAWEIEPVKLTADQALAAHEDGGREGKSAKAEAVEFLRSVLAGGPKPAGEIKSDATEAGITAKPLRVAREALGIRPAKSSMTGGWVWGLPKMPSEAEDAHFQKRAPSGVEGTFGTREPPSEPADDGLDLPDCLGRV